MLSIVVYFASNIFFLITFNPSFQDIIVSAKHISSEDFLSISFYKKLIGSLF